MKRRFLLLILVTIILMAWFHFQKPTVPTEPPTRAATQSTPRPVTSPPKKVSLPKPPVSPPVQTQAPQPLPPDPHVPPPHSVPFELINGLVVSQGDILIGKPTSDDFPQSGFVQEPDLNLWPTGPIPYSIDPQLPNPERVLRTVQYFNENSPVKLVPYHGEKDSIVFAPGQELCLSYLGRIGGAQPIYLDDRCADNEIRHEVLHALGFIHEQSRPDRDQFIQVQWDNIEQTKQNQFFIIAEKANSPLKDRPFDYNSVMIYSTSLFAVDRSKPTMLSRTGKPIEPNHSSLSPEDLERLKLLFGH